MVFRKDLVVFGEDNDDSDDGQGTNFQQPSNGRTAGAFSLGLHPQFLTYNCYIAIFYLLFFNCNF